MKIINLIESFVKRSLICFALIVLGFSVLGSMLDVAFLGKGLGITQLFGFFLFSVLLSLSFEIAKLFKKNTVLMGAARFVLSLVCFITVFFLNSSFSVYLSEKQNPTFSIIVITFVYVIIYVVCSLFSIIVKAVKNRFLNSAKEYENLYTDKQ